MIIFTIRVTFLECLILMCFFSLLDIRKRNNRSHGKRKNENLKRKDKHVLTLSELSIILKHSGRHMALSRLVTLSISLLTVPRRYFFCGSFMFLFCLVFAMFCARLFICALWSPAGKGLTSWLSFVVSSLSLSLSHWYPGSGVVLDCIDS